ncbi:hypothetical protein [uncultured Desulfuromusa sp.]|uniref:hypothetical protein n=1 Tax=uncultured Desulfuromusa sp. TaxID=219183 RepID=UPI002AA90514|nr:hypothetical protein [uncultured Desulfuromusa sp.]
MVGVTRVDLPYKIIETQSARKIIVLLRQRAIDSGHAFSAELSEVGIIIEQCRDARPVPGACQFR